MLQFLIRLQPARPGFLDGATSEEDRIVEEHFRYLERLTQQQVVLLAGRTTNTDPSSFGIVLLRAENEAAAKQVMNDDPAVRAKVFRAELFPYRIALGSPEGLESAIA